MQTARMVAEEAGRDVMYESARHSVFIAVRDNWVDKVGGVLHAQVKQAEQNDLRSPYVPYWIQ